jgi:hypothetical protein
MIEWTKISAGHYQTFGRKSNTGTVFRIDVESVSAGWQLRVNEVFRGLHPTARAAKERAQHLVDTNDFSLNKIGD